MNTGGGERLPCGALVDDLIDQVATGRGEQRNTHQAHCPRCQAALAEFNRLWAPVAELAAVSVRAPAHVLSAVMRRIRELASNAWHTTIPGERGTTKVAARVVAAIARRAAQRVTGVGIVLGRATESAEARRVAAATERNAVPDSAVGVSGSSAVVDLALAAGYGHNLQAVTSRIRENVARDLHQLAGVDHVEVNITVDDIF